MMSLKAMDLLKEREWDISYIIRMLFSWMYDTIRNHSFTVQIPHPFDLLYDVIRSWLIFNPRLRYSFKNILVMMLTLY
jgi:hypothetical protein